MNKKILIITIVIAVAGVGFLLINQLSKTIPSEPSDTTRLKPPIINQPSGNLTCEQLYNEIENDMNETNYCQTDSDCDVLVLGDDYITFGCYHFINKEVDKEQFYQKMRTYVFDRKCTNIINECAPAPEAKCVSNKCTYVRG